MGRVAPARLLAARLLSDIRRRDARAREVLRASEELDRLSERDRALAVRLVLGVTATSGALDSAIDAQLRRGRLEPRVRDALRLSAFELLWLSTPPAVACDQGVELVRTSAPRAAGLANAVLRRIAALRPSYDDARARVAAGAADAATCARASGMPTWLAERIGRARGGAALASVCSCQLDPAPVYVAANLLRHDADEVEGLLESEGLEPRPCVLPGAFVLGRPAGLAATGLVGDAEVVVSDLAAQEVCLIAAAPAGSSMLEVGQGRATKTLLLASVARMTGGSAPAVAIDVDPGKVDLAGRRLAQGRVEGVTELALDACRLAEGGLPEPLDRAFDVVFVDAPCSGTGTMRRHPEIAWSLEERSLDAERPDSLLSLQLRILSAAASRVAEGGMLVYATCSVLREEDEGVVERFLASEAGASFAPEDVRRAPALAEIGNEAAAEVASHVTDKGMFLTVPGPDGPDGHFCARLRRMGSASGRRG